MRIFKPTPLFYRIFKRNSSLVIILKNNVSHDRSQEYPYYCPYCDENMYSFEVEDIPETMGEHKMRVIHYLGTEDYLHLNAWFVRNVSGTMEAIMQLLAEGIIRMRNCEASAVELNTVE